MDKEQAIEIIETHSENILSDSLVGRALNMAIDALKAQLSCEGTTSALIDRQAAIDAINSWRGRFSEEYNEAIDDCENSIKALPTIQPESSACEYCHEDSDGYVMPIEKNGHAYIRFGMDGWELSLHAKGWHGSAKIKYCPICGRRLTHE